MIGDHAPVVSLDAAAEVVLSALQGSTTGPDSPWISYAADYGKDRFDRVILVEITHPSGVCESFEVTIKRDPIG